MSGVEFSTLYTARALDRSRWCAQVVCPTEGDLPQHLRDAHVHVAIVPQARFFSSGFYFARRVMLNPLALGANLGAVVRSADTLARFFARRRPDLIVTKGLLAHFYGGLAARRLHVPCVWHVQDRVSERAGGIFPWLMAYSGQVLATQIIVDAESIARQLAPTIPRARISVIWNGVDTDEFSPEVDGSRVRAEWGARPDEVLIGCIARLVPWKGQHILLEAFAELAGEFPEARVVLVGSALFETDDYARRLEADARRLGIRDRVCFAGFRSDLPEALAALDVVAHTPLEKDSTPLAVVSALAAGKPVICSAVDGTAELIQNEIDGLLVPPGDPKALAVQLRRLLSDRELRATFAQRARAFAVRELSLGEFTRKCEAVFEHAVQNMASH